MTSDVGAVGAGEQQLLGPTPTACSEASKALRAWRAYPGPVQPDALGMFHMTVRTYTRRPRDLFRKRFWVRCWDCDLKAGPFRCEQDAKDAAWLLTYGVQALPT